MNSAVTRLAPTHLAGRLAMHLDAVNAAIHDRGGVIDWQHPMPLARARAWCEAGQAWALPDRADGWLATAVVTETDPVWPEALGQDGTALYLSKVAAWPGKGWGRVLLGEVARLARSRGKTALRCDVMDNPRLRDWWQRQGFHPRGDASFRGVRGDDVRVRLYEREEATVGGE